MFLLSLSYVTFGDKSNDTYDKYIRTIICLEYFYKKLVTNNKFARYLLLVARVPRRER